MKSEADTQILDFARRFLEQQGAVVEACGASLEAMLPADLAGALELPEYVRFSGPGEEDSGALPLGYGSLALDRMLLAAVRAAPVVVCEAEVMYLKGQGFDRLVSEAFSFSGARGHAENTAQVRQRYALVLCWYAAQSDEQKEGIVKTAFNLESGVAVPGLAQWMQSFPLRESSRQPPCLDPIPAARTSLMMEALQSLVEADLRPFAAAMQRRLARDIGSVGEYYQSLHREMEQGLARGGLSDSLVRERQEKMALLPAELMQKADELRAKYSIRVAFRPVALMLVEMPCVRIHYVAQAGRNTHRLPLTYNPLVKALDPAVCPSCGRGTTRLVFDRQKPPRCPACPRTGSEA
jgi:hypothetical protein